MLNTVLLLFALYPVPQSQGPKVFIDSESYAKTETGLFGGVHTKQSVVSSPEIAQRFGSACPGCRITIKKDAADYVAVFAESGTYGSKSWSWAVYENEEGLLLRKGETALFNNSIKDVVTVIMRHWNKGGGVETAQPEPEANGAAPISATIMFYRKEGGFKTSFNPTLYDGSEEMARLTKNKFFVMTANPGINVFSFKRPGAPGQDFTVSAEPGALYYWKPASPHTHSCPGPEGNCTEGHAEVEARGSEKPQGVADLCGF